MKKIILFFSVLVVGNFAVANSEVEACIFVSRYDMQNQVCDNIGVFDVENWLPVAKEAGAVISYGRCEKRNKVFDNMSVVFKDAAFFKLAQQSLKHMGIRDSYKHIHEVSVDIGPCK